MLEIVRAMSGANPDPHYKTKQKFAVGRQALKAEKKI